MNTISTSNSKTVSSLRVTFDMLFAILFLTALTAATADMVLGRFLAAAGALAATLVFGWAGRGMLQHLDRWSANWDE